MQQHISQKAGNYGPDNRSVEDPMARVTRLTNDLERMTAFKAAGVQSSAAGAGLAPVNPALAAKLITALSGIGLDCSELQAAVIAGEDDEDILAAATTLVDDFLTGAAPAQAPVAKGQPSQQRPPVRSSGGANPARRPDANAGANPPRRPDAQRSRASSAKASQPDPYEESARRLISNWPGSRPA
jgi:hypothetical protein